ncbi:hypothetical protein FA13DRAFT_1746157 [Coprinellus micaceus]|uniref:C2H2-type domain-containing protein n=1 Tax=Coprinellus micaceus TaxID=71717 RepID=A0A4Y7SBV5_COPMI|nr:hypothetical protein FA13DRAFT_1746157 [Coprinellus micaceus]
MAPLFGFYDYEAHFSHQRCIEGGSAPVICPRSESKQDPGEIGSPERRHCPLCNVYFGTMNRLEVHNRNTHNLETPESLARENLEFTLQLRREYVEHLRQDTERAMEEDFELQEKKNVYKRLQYEEWLEQCRFREQPIVKQAKRVNKGDTNSRSGAHTTKTPQLRKGPSIGIRAIIPGGPVKTAGGGRAGPAKVPGTQQSTNGVLRSFQSCSHNLVATDWYCPICRIYLSTAARYNKHKTKVHKDFEGDLAEAERKRWEKAERQRLREEEEKRRRDKAKKSQGKGKRKPQPLQNLPGILRGKVARHCGGCQITFDTDELFTSHISKYRELRLSHRPAFPHPNGGVVVKQLLRILREEPSSEWNRKPKSAVKAGIELPHKGFDRMKKRTRVQRKVQREKREREEFCERL